MIPIEAHEFDLFIHGPRAASYGKYAKKANESHGTAWLMPVLHMLLYLRGDAAVAVVLFVEGGIKMVHNGSEVALQGVVVGRALTVAIDAVVYVGNGCFRRPLRDAHRRVLYDLADNLWLEWAAVSEDPVGVVDRHGGTVTYFSSSICLITASPFL